jgi:hypothetical protein
MSSEPVRLERRVGQRFEVNIPLAVQFGGHAFAGFTQDVSSRGIFFYTDADVPAGSVVDLIFTMPSEITLGESMRVRCRAHVLRICSANPGRQNGVAARLDSYQYLPSSGPESAVEFLRASSGSHLHENPHPVPR